MAAYFSAHLEDARAGEADSDAAPPEANYNVAPTAKVLAVRAADNERQLGRLRWGLVPFWAKDLKIGAKMINARSETVAEKPAFRAAYKSRRCLVPADGFYEWAKVAGGGPKQPYFIHRRDDDPLVFAGLWERWRPSESADAESDDVIETCTILTTAANADIEPVHNRMPVLIPPARWDDWLDPSTDLDSLGTLLVPAPNGLLQLRPVSTLVNRVANNSPELLEEVSVGE